MPVAAVAVAGEAEEAFDHADDEEDSYTEDVLVAGHVIESELGTSAKHVFEHMCMESFSSCRRCRMRARRSRNGQNITAGPPRRAWCAR